MKQKISRKDLHTIYNSDICAGWKSKIEKHLVEQQLNEQIEVEDSVLNEAYGEANDKQKKLLEKYFDIKTPKKIIEQINGIDDLFKITGKKRDEVFPWKNPTTKEQRSQNAYAMIQVMTEAYNQGVVLDFKNRNQSKYFIWWEKNASGSWVLDAVTDDPYFSCMGFGLYFATQEAARDAATKFKDIFIDYLPE